MNWFVKTCAVIIVACSSLAYAGEAQPLAQDPLVETRLNAISENLRCLVCQKASGAFCTRESGFESVWGGQDHQESAL